MKPFQIKYNRFFQGFAPLVHIESLTELGNKGHASSMKNTDVLGEVITQGPALTDLTNGTQAGVVDQLIAHITDKAVLDDKAYGIGTTKLFEISASTVASGGTPSWPVTITSAEQGHTAIPLKGSLYYLFSRSGDGAIGKFDLSTTFNHAWQTGLNKSDLMPADTKEDILIFGHGKNVGVYFASTDSIAKTRLDFGDGHEVADVAFHGNQWLIAVNSGISGINRNSSQIFSYDAGGITTLLSDEVAVGLQRIGFILPINGIVYVAYQDLSFTGGFKIGFLSGRKIEPLVHFKGTLPTYRQKTLFKNKILFPSSGEIYAAGAIVGELPFSLSQHAPGGHATVGAIAAPFGTPLVASEEDTDKRLAKFDGFSTDGNWRSIISNITNGKHLGYVEYVEVLTRTLGENARCDLKLEYNQASSSSSAHQITGEGERRFIFKIDKRDVEDVRLFLDFSNGNATNAVSIREINLFGHFISR